MAQVKVYYDSTGNTLTVWFGNPQDEYISEETGDEVVLMKDKSGNVIYRPPPQMTDKKCEKCTKPMLLRVGKRGPFLACSGFPRCRNLKKIPAAEAA